MDICIGINAIHYFASGEKTFAPPVLAAESGTGARDPDVVAALAGTRVSDEEYIDLSSPTLRERAKEHPDDVARRLEENDAAISWQQSGIYRLYAALAKDESAGGLRLMVNAPNELKLRVGDLVGLRYPTPDRWRVSVVRWIRSPQADVMEAGLQLLAPELTTAAVRRHSDNGGRYQFFQALLLPENQVLQLPESLLLPSGTYRLNEKLAIKGEGDELETVTALQVLEQCGGFDQLVVGAEENEA